MFDRSLGLRANALAGALLLFMSASASALEIFVTPSTQMVDVGDIVNIDVNIGGLGVGATPSLGAFDIDVAFDASLLSPTSVGFGTGLDLGIPSNSITGVFLSTPVDVFEVSLLTPGELDSSQPSAFTLFTVAFDALAAGTSLIGLENIVLSDELGNQLTANITGGEVVVKAAQQTPEPAALALIALGLAGMGYVRRRRILSERPELD